MGKFLVTTLLFLFCCSFFSIGWAAGRGSIDGNNPSWGSSVEDFPDLVHYKTVGDIKYYQNPDSAPVYDLMTGIKSSHVFYGFKNDILYARILKIDTVEDFQKAHDHMVELFGKPKEKIDEITHIDRWQTENLKVKLKYSKDKKSLKIGTYHMRSAGKNFDIEKSFESTP